MLGGVCFIVPGLIIILGLSALFLAGSPPLWVQGAAAGAGAAVPAVALQAAVSLLPASRKRMTASRAARVRWLAYFAAGAVASATAGPFVVAVLLACGLTEVALHLHSGGGRPPGGVAGDLPARGALGGLPFLAGPSLAGSPRRALAAGGIGALAWVAIKVGALSFGGGFVIIPLMQHDAVVTYHWMTGAQFLNAVALGQVTPGPVVLTVAVVGYAAAGIGGGLLATLIAFLPSFVFVIAGGDHLGRLRSSDRAQAFLSGAGWRPSGRSPGRPSRSAWNSPTSGRRASCCWPPPGYWPCAGALSPRCCVPAAWASSPPWPAPGRPLTPRHAGRALKTRREGAEDLPAGTGMQPNGEADASARHAGSGAPAGRPGARRLRSAAT